MMLDERKLRDYAARFNALDEESVATSIPDAEAAEWMAGQIPRLDIPDEDIERTYYFRWWAYRKHIRDTPQGRIVTEFLPVVPWAGRYNAISCAAGHHIYEGRWLRDAGPLTEYARFWYRGGGALHDYSNWIADALYRLCLTTGDFGPAADLLPDLVKDEEAWEREQRHACGLFWSDDGRDGGEFSVSGPGLRTTSNCYRWAGMRAVAAIAEKAGKGGLRETYMRKADALGRLIRERLWDEDAGFFRCIPLPERRTDVESWSFGRMNPAMVARELWGYLPWYFGLPAEGCECAWRELFDPDGFHGEYGPTTAERRHPCFGIFYTGGELSNWMRARTGGNGGVGEKGHECLWNGPSWPFATSQALTALANHLAEGLRPAASAEEYVGLLARYARSHRIARDGGAAEPWIDENLNPDTGDWISRTRLKSWSDGNWDAGKGGYERGRCYNHSTFCDLVISGLFGVRPAEGGAEISPLLAGGGWPYACLDAAPCRGHLLTVLYDESGARYGAGRGYRVLVDGETKFTADLPVKCRIWI